ncbi:Hypothetical_protein [Hexamita inflata]|uniref:Hypothetical_protein n=1 Tax=Hexamita inflata TaxID=28002 RepID=A0AA86TXV3_9EUKA|nr:Hypothetical protein HINF_LOCUS20624 [Hexamita inflata]
MAQLIMPSYQSKCDKYLLIDNVQYEYCQRDRALNLVTISNNFTLSQHSSFLFINTEVTKNTQINANINYVNVFAVFGFHISKQMISDCDVDISVNFYVVIAALLCLECELEISLSKLTFQAQGQKVSGVLMRSDNLYISNTNIQFRVNSSQASGIINEVPQNMIFQISDSAISGHNFGSKCGYLIGVLSIFIEINQKNIIVCSIDNNVGVINSLYIVSEPESFSCNICDNGNVGYGICVSFLEWGVVQNNLTVSCQFPFEYQQGVCVCSEGYVINQSGCVNVIKGLQKLEAKNVDTSALNGIQFDFSEFKVLIQQIIKDLEYAIAQNTSEVLKILEQLQNLVNGKINTHLLTRETVIQNVNDLLNNQVNTFNNNLDLNYQHISKQLNYLMNYLQTQININVTNLQKLVQNNQNELDTQISNNYSNVDLNLSNTQNQVQSILNEIILDTSKTTIQLQNIIKNNLSSTMLMINENANIVLNNISNLRQTSNQTVNNILLHIATANKSFTEQIQLMNNTISNIISNSNTISNIMLANLNIMDKNLQNQIHNLKNGTTGKIVSFKLCDITDSKGKTKIGVQCICINDECLQITKLDKKYLKKPK